MSEQLLSLSILKPLSSSVTLESLFKKAALVSFMLTIPGTIIMSVRTELLELLLLTSDP